MNNGMTIMRSDALQAITKSEIEAQLDAANKYPRQLDRVKNKILELATQDKDVAASCFYALPRGGKTIHGISVRFAEILVSCWGNIRAGARVISNDGRTITAQGICHDIESNVSVTVEVIRRITDKNGNTFNEDMQVVVSNAACAIALRNAAFKVIPVAITHKLQDKIKDVAMGTTADFETTKKKAIDYFTKQGVTIKQILNLISKHSVEDINRDDVFTLRGLVQAINDGDTTIQQAFEIRTSAGSGMDKVANSMTPPPAVEDKTEEVPAIQNNVNFENETESTNLFDTPTVDAVADKKEKGKK